MSRSAIAPVEDAESMMKRLRELHRQADERLRELDRHVWLSPDEQIEISRLKKERLRLKDEMRDLASRSGS